MGPIFIPNFILNYDVECDIDYLLIVDVEYPAHSQPLRKDLPFLSVKRVTDGHNKLVCTYQKFSCVVELLKKAIEHEIISKIYMLL